MLLPEATCTGITTDYWDCSQRCSSVMVTMCAVSLTEWLRGLSSTLSHDKYSTNNKMTCVIMELARMYSMSFNVDHSYYYCDVRILSRKVRCVTFFLLFFSIHVWSSPFFFSLSLLLLVVTQIRGNVAGSSPPPRYDACVALLTRQDFISAFFPRRLASILYSVNSHVDHS